MLYIHVQYSTCLKPLSVVSFISVPYSSVLWECPNFEQINFFLTLTEASQLHQRITENIYHAPMRYFVFIYIYIYLCTLLNFLCKACWIVIQSVELCGSNFLFVHAVLFSGRNVRKMALRQSDSSSPETGYKRSDGGPNMRQKRGETQFESQLQKEPCSMPQNIIISDSVWDFDNKEIFN